RAGSPLTPMLFDPATPSNSPVPPEMARVWIAPAVGPKIAPPPQAGALWETDNGNPLCARKIPDTDHPPTILLSTALPGSRNRFLPNGRASAPLMVNMWRRAEGDGRAV